MHTRRRLGSVTILATLFAMCLSNACAQSGGGSSQVYELRLYTANAGKLARFQSVFRAQALPLFAKYGIENAFDGTVLEGARVDGADAGNMLVCVLAHKSRADADRSWAAFEGDAEWKSAVKRSEQNGPLLAKPAVSIFMTPTDFSPPWNRPAWGQQPESSSCGNTTPVRKACREQLTSSSRAW